MRLDIAALSGWCSDNGIKRNTDKTKLMVFGGCKQIKQLPMVNIQVEGAPILTVKSYKYLGVTLDGQLNYNKHVNKIIASASLKLRQLSRMRSFLNTAAATLVYKNMILPVIQYGDLFLVGANVETKRKLQVLQNRGLRCALKRDIDISIDELHSESNLFKLIYRREQHLLNFMFDMSQQSKKVNKVRDAGVLTRSQKFKTLKLTRPKTEKFKKSLTYLGPQKWNGLPGLLMQTDSRPEYKAKLSQYVDLKVRSNHLDFGT